MSLKSGISGASTGAAIGSAVPGLGTAIGAGVGALAGLFSGDDDNNAAAEAQAKAVAAINALDVDDLSKRILLDQYQQNGKLEPEMIQHLNLNADTQQLLTENPENKAKQEYTMNALKQLSQTGMSAQDLAQMQQSRSQVAEDTAAKTNQLLQQSQMRGQLGGGDTLAAQLMANQQGSQQASHDAINTAAAAAQARQAALMNYGNMAGQVRGQDFNTANINNQNDIARKQFLDQNSLSRQAANIQAQNNANMYNVQRQQTVGDANTGAQNAESARQANLKANLAATKATALAKVYGGQSDFDAKQAANAADSNTKFWSGISGTAQTLGNKGTFDFLKPKTPTTYDANSGTYSQPIGPGLAHGGEVDGPEIVPGDSPENDVVPIMASGGEFVIPKSKMKSAESAKSFIDNHFGKSKEHSKHEALLDLIAELHSKKSKE